MSAPFDVIAVLYPKPGKTDRVQELLAIAAKEVEDKEPGVLRYHLQREIKGDAPKLVVLETYKDKAALETHGKAKHMGVVAKAGKAEDLFEKPMELLFTKSVAGFASRL